MPHQASLNFLSPEKKSLLRTGFVFAYVQTMLFAVFVVVTFCTGMLIALRMMLGETLLSIETQTAGNDRDINAVTQEITAVNAYLTREQINAKGFTKWSTVVTEITDAVPAGMHINRLSFNELGQVAISGTAQERSAVLAFESKLKSSPNFKDVTAPLSNILTQYDVDFQFGLTMVNPPQVPQTETTTRRPRRATTPVE